MRTYKPLPAPEFAGFLHFSALGNPDIAKNFERPALTRLFKRLLNSIFAPSPKTEKPRFYCHWVTTSKSLSEIAAILELNQIEKDDEDYWEWIVGTENDSGLRIDVYRTHEVKPGEITQVFFAQYSNQGLGELPEKVADLVAKKLVEAGLEKVNYGLIFNGYHDTFQAEVKRTWENSA